MAINSIKKIYNKFIIWYKHFYKTLMSGVVKDFCNTEYFCDFSIRVKICIILNFDNE